MKCRSEKQEMPASVPGRTANCRRNAVTSARAADVSTATAAYRGPGAGRRTPSVWNFQVLAVPEIGDSAAKAAAQADFVILSMHRKAQLSVRTRDWIERSSGLITDNRSALVALLDQPGRKRGTVASTLDYLREVADRKGISFYTHTTFGLSTN